MKIQHTPIEVEKAGSKFVAKCQVLPEGWKAKAIEYEQAGNTHEEANGKAMKFLLGENNELQEVETFENPQENGKTGF